MFISSCTRLGDALVNQNLRALEVRTLQADSISVSLLKKFLRLHQPLPFVVCLNLGWPQRTQGVPTRCVKLNEEVGFKRNFFDVIESYYVIEQFVKGPITSLRRLKVEVWSVFLSQIPSREVPTPTLKIAASSNFLQRVILPHFDSTQNLCSQKVDWVVFGVSGWVLFSSDWR